MASHGMYCKKPKVDWSEFPDSFALWGIHGPMIWTPQLQTLRERTEKHETQALNGGPGGEIPRKFLGGE